jgi:flagellar biogenesis protein FliO
MSAPEILRLSVSLVVLVGGLLVVRRWSRNGGRPSRRLAGSTRTPIRVTGRAGITRHASVAVVEVGRQRFLIGAGEHGVNLLAELPAPADGTGAADTADTVDLSVQSSPLDEATLPDLAPTGDAGHLDTLTDPSASHSPRMGLVARLQRSTLRTADASRPRADQR